MFKTLTKGALLAGALMLSSIPVQAAEEINVVVLDGYPKKSMWVAELSNFFIPEVDKRLAETGNYKINWQESYGGSIVKVKGVLDGIRNGLGDLGVVTTIFHSSKLPSQAISAVTPFVAPDARAIAKAVDEIAVEFPTMKSELEAQNQVYLATGVVLDSYQVFSREPVAGIADVKGKKVAGGGMNLRYLDGIDGAVGVRGSLTQFYNMLQTGLVDQALLWPEAAATYQLAEVAPYMLRVDFGAVNSKTVTVNKQFWDKLPEEVQKTLREVAVLYRDHIAAIAMDRASESLEAYIAAGGSVAEISAEERTAWAKSIPNLGKEWADKLDANGEPGTDMLKAYLAKLNAAGYAGERDWTAE